MPAAADLENLLTPHVRGSLPIHLTAWDGSTAGPDDAPHVVVHSPDALRRVLWHPGELGLAQAYVTGELDVLDDLDLALRHIRRVAEERGLHEIRPRPRVLWDLLRFSRRFGLLRLPPAPPATQARVRGRLHSRLRDRAVISHHYDLSNDFYQLILDDHMAYSSGRWRSDDPSFDLHDAQTDKLIAICRKIGLHERPGQRLLDVGCGWGSLSLYAAQHYDAQVVGVTLSAEQKSFVDTRIAERGLHDRVEIRVQDYRDVDDPPFDAVASVEMGEHVGAENYPTYARVLHDALVPGGRLCVQQMSRPSGKHPGGGPFIEAFIAPDMHMRPVEETAAALAATGLEIVDIDPMREDYVRTVDGWYANFEKNVDEIVGVVGEETARVWRLYLLGGRRAFDDGRMGVDQITARRV